MIMNLLQNNAPVMGTEVETFLIEEVTDLIYDGDKLQQWHDKVVELGLTGQTKVVTKEKSPIPFLYMKTGLVNIFETLCPVKSPVESFDKTPIPLEILDLIALSKKEHYFTGISIWYDDKSPDPVCIGTVDSYCIHKKGSYTEPVKDRFRTKEDCMAFIEKEGSPEAWEPYFHRSENKNYLIGRWGDVKQSLEELKERATQRFIEDRTDYAQRQIVSYQREITDAVQKAFERFN